MHAKRRHRRKLLCSLAARGGGAKVGSSALAQFSQEALQLPLPRAAGRCAQKGAVAVGFLAAWLHAAAARRLAAPRSFPGAATSAAHRGRRSDAHPGHRRLLNSLSARGGDGAEGHSTALVQRSKESLQLPLTKSGGAMRTMRAQSPRASLMSGHRKAAACRQHRARAEPSSAAAATAH
jgi:hypothetical protein